MRVVDVSKELEISGDWLRRLEKAGIIPPIPRDRNGYRRYTPEMVACIRRVIFQKQKQVSQ
jgi:DNA-binding transcriptional MerR regulator